ncbi:TraR/DksA C4-type zinc finger protein [Paraburkholderia sp. EG287A]|uniref:TraR/DksA C4-type zinc finger protein n=1 Tax=Paraburkholderia sp. EG287A TaxID=3237012 RepID=UPI0034D31B9D
MQERHADPLDEAAALSSAIADAAIEEVRRANAPEKHPDFDGESCVECGELIPKERLALGKVRCVHCQGRLELRQRQHGRPQARSDWLDSDQ